MDRLLEHLDNLYNYTLEESIADDIIIKYVIKEFPNTKDFLPALLNSVHTPDREIILDALEYLMTNLEDFK